MGVSENWVLEVAVLQQEPKMQHHPLENLNVFSNFCLCRSGKKQGHELNEFRIGHDTESHAETGSLIDTIMEGVWFASR